MLWPQFSAIYDNFRRKDWRFFSKTNVMIKFLHDLVLFLVKNANFFGENIKNHNRGPWSPWLQSKSHQGAVIVNEAVTGEIFRLPANFPEKGPEPLTAGLVPLAVEPEDRSFRVFRIRFSDGSGNLEEVAAQLHLPERHPRLSHPWGRCHIFVNIFAVDKVKIWLFFQL
jgi:hypothetical protein